jgi:L-iditol 2-dehydrogenase
MKALVLEDVARFAVREMPAPAVNARDVLIRIGAVGICGTDLHIFNGFANYNRDQNGYQIPLTQAPQILGHEFCGVVEVVGKDVTKFKPGDRVIADQVLNCHSKRRAPLCGYCETGDSHQCAYLDELGITGLPGAFADLVSISEPNVLLLPAGVPVTKGAIIEPLACVLHSSDRMERSWNRYDFDGKYRIRNILITGAGPSGLLFIQYLRNVKRFDGQIFVADMRASRLALAEKLGSTPLDVRAVDLASEIRKRTNGELIHYWIDASGAGPVFDLPPLVLRHQATFLFYGSGHTGRDVGCLVPFQFMETNIVTSCGASGGFEADGTPVVYRRSMEYVRDGLIDAEPLLTHQYARLSELQQASQVDSLGDDFIKGAWIVNPAL